MLLRTLFGRNVLRPVQRNTSVVFRLFSSLPDHILVPMPALSPTMETGSIANWLLKEGDAFEAGQAICEVETDKATVTYDATDDGFIAKILVGSGEIEVGVPLMITVEESEHVPAFANYTVDSSSSEGTLSALKTDDLVHALPATTVQPLSSDTLLSTSTGQRVVASPLARRLAREAQVDLSRVVGALGAPSGSGPHGRLLGTDVLRAVASGTLSQAAHVAAPAPVVPVPSSIPSSLSSENASRGEEVFASYPGCVHTMAGPGSVSSLMGALSSQSKKEVPHYYLSVEIDVSNILSLKDSFGENNDISTQDILVKAAAKAMEKVPAVNAAWKDSYVRQYDQVDVNLITGEGSSLQAPLLRNVGARGLTSISQEINEVYEQLKDNTATTDTLETGTFTIHNLGMYGIQSAAAIVLPPQACALSLGAIVDTVVPNPSAPDGEEIWKVAPILVSTLSCDHRVIDGAVGAGWLKAFKEYAENPLTLLL